MIHRNSPTANSRRTGSVRPGSALRDAAEDLVLYLIFASLVLALAACGGQAPDDEDPALALQAEDEPSAPQHIPTLPNCQARPEVCR